MKGRGVRNRATLNTICLPEFLMPAGHRDGEIFGFFEPCEFLGEC